MTCHARMLAANIGKRFFGVFESRLTWSCRLVIDLDNPHINGENSYGLA